MARPEDRAFKPLLTGLEPRELPATAVANLKASPSILTPPNNRFVAVQISGAVIESSAKAVPNARFQVSDEYRRFEPGGPVKLQRIGPGAFTFQFTVVLQARRSDEFPAGRRYYVNVGAQDSQNGAGLTVPVLVPHSKLPTTEVPSSSTAHIKVHAKKT